MKTKQLFNLVMVLAMLTGLLSTASAQEKIDRTILPIQPPKYKPITEMDARKATKPERFEIKPPADAPNVVIVLIDDIGFGAIKPFGGAIETPTLERLATDGLRFNHFHTTALCSPTRASLLSGRNHHQVNVGSVMEIATGIPWQPGGTTQQRQILCGNTAS